MVNSVHRFSKQTGFINTKTATCQLPVKRGSPEGTAPRQVNFTYNDPVLSIIDSVNRLPESKLIWKPREDIATSGDLLYGGGIGAGRLMRLAWESLPDIPNTFPLLVGISLDAGNAGHNDSVTAWYTHCLSGETLSHDGVGLLGYTPCLGIPDAEKKTVWGRQCKQKLKDFCLQTLATDLVTAATDGVVTTIHGRRRHIFVRLVLLALDSPERRAMFNLLGARFCATCVWLPEHPALVKQQVTLFV